MIIQAVAQLYYGESIVGYEADAVEMMHILHNPYYGESMVTYEVERAVASCVIAGRGFAVSHHNLRQKHHNNSLIMVN